MTGDLPGGEVRGKGRKKSKQNLSGENLPCPECILNFSDPDRRVSIFSSAKENTKEHHWLGEQGRREGKYTNSIIAHGRKSVNTNPSHSYKNNF